MLLQDDDSSLNISAVMAPSAESLATYEEHAKGFPAPPTRKSHHKKRPSLEGSQDSPKRRGRPRKASVGLMQQSLDAWLTKPDLPVSMEAQETVALNVLASGVDTKKTVAPILTSAGAPVSPTKRGPGRPRKIQLAPELPMDIPVPVDAQAMAPLMGTEILGKKRGRRPKEDKGDESVLTREIGYSSQLVVTPSVMSTVSSLSLNPLASEDSTLYSHYRFGQSAMQGRGMAVPFSDNQRIARANLANSEPTFSLGKTQPVENKEQFSVGMRMCLNCGSDLKLSTTVASSPKKSSATTPSSLPHAHAGHENESRKRRIDAVTMNDASAVDALRRALVAWAHGNWTCLIELGASSLGQYKTVESNESESDRKQALQLFLSLAFVLGLNHEAFCRNASIEELVFLATQVVDAHPIYNTSDPILATTTMQQGTATLPIQSLSEAVEGAHVRHCISSILRDPNNRSSPQRANLDSLVLQCSIQDLEALPQPETLLSAVLLSNTQLISLLLPLPSITPQLYHNALRQAVNANQTLSLITLLDAPQCPKLDGAELQSLLQSSIRKSQLAIARELVARAPIGLLFDSIGLEHIVFICANGLGVDAASTLEFLLSKNLNRVNGRDPQARIEPLQPEMALIWNANLSLACMGHRALRLDRLTRKDALGLALSRASLKGNLWCIRVLVEHGEVDVRWRRGVPLRLAQVGKQAECGEFLKGAAAGTNHGKWYRGFVEAMKATALSPKPAEGIVAKVAAARSFKPSSPASSRCRKDIVVAALIPPKLSQRVFQPIPSTRQGANEQMEIKPLQQSVAQAPVLLTSHSIPAMMDTPVNAAATTTPEMTPTSAMATTPLLPIPAIAILMPNAPSPADRISSDLTSSQPSLKKQVDFKEPEYIKPYCAVDRHMSQMSAVSSDTRVSVGNYSLNTPDLIRVTNATPDSMTTSIQTNETGSSAVGIKNVGRTGNCSVSPIDRQLRLADPTTLVSLPDSVLYQIVFKLNKKDLAYFTSTCVKLSQLCLSVEFMASYVLHSLGPAQALINILHSPDSDDKPHLLTSLLALLPQASIPDLISICIESHQPEAIPYLFHRSGSLGTSFLPSFILKAIEMRDVDCLGVLLNHPAADVDASGALVAAVGRGDGAIVDVLLRAGASVSVNEYVALRSLCAMPMLGRSAGDRSMTVRSLSSLELCVGVNRANIAGKLIMAGSQVSARDYEAFKSAAKGGDADLLRVLLKEVLSNSNVVGSGTVRPVRRSVVDDKRLLNLLSDVYMTVVRYGHGECLRVLMAEPRTYSGGEVGLRTVVVPAAMEAIRHGWVGCVKAISESKCWLDIVKLIGGDVLLDMAAKFEYAPNRIPGVVGIEFPTDYHERQVREMPLIEIDGDISIPQSAAMVEAMLAGVAGNTAARFTAFETTIMKKGIDSYAFLTSVKPTERDSPFQKIKDSLLIHSAWLGHETVMDAVVSILQPDVTGNAGESAIMAATLMGHTKIVASLFSAGVQFERVSEVAFHVASDRGHKETVKYLTVMRNIRVKMAKEMEAKREKEAKEAEGRRKLPSFSSVPSLEAVKDREAKYAREAETRKKRPSFKSVPSALDNPNPTGN
ncbi:hypothetical protein BC830DRAFT_1164714 [Chytriomyces sp. MP71]|nr:hypothetical protein BC830DRAFT_1164714 [Chytriomyces sp. MP71]